jgi:hypothetical protein
LSVEWSHANQGERSIVPLETKATSNLLSATVGETPKPESFTNAKKVAQTNFYFAQH